MSNPYGPGSYPPQYGYGGHHSPGAPGAQQPPPGFAPPPPPPPPGSYGPGHPYTSPQAPVFPPPASWGARAGAYLLDTFLMMLIIIVLIYGPVVTAGVLLQPDDDSPEAVVFGMIAFIFMIVAPVASFCYMWIPHARSGQTLGKRALGIKLIHLHTGEPPSLGQSAGRQLIGILLGSVTCIGSLVDLLWPLWDEPYRQAIHDKAVDTRVIRVRGADAQQYAPAAPYAGQPPGAGGWY